MTNSTQDKQSIINELANASRALQQAFKVGTELNAMAADVPAFQRMQAMVKELNALMLEVNKLRGF